MEIIQLIKMHETHSKKSMTIEEALFLYSVTALCKAKTVLECGTYRGMSTLWLASAVEPRDGHVYTWDVSERNHFFKGTDVESRITFTQGGFAENVGEVIALNPPHPWLFFMDGASPYEKSKAYWDAIVNHLEPNDYAVFHDTIHGITSPQKRRRGMLVNEINGTVNLLGYTGVAVYRHVEPLK